MAETPYNHYALYEPDASPDLTATGEYNSAIMGIDSDMHSEREERLNADNALADRITAETNGRAAADTALDTKFTNGLNNVTNGLTTVGNAVSKVESDYKAADAALAVRINNAEAEISANSADLTGIKSLTYGEQHVHFVESDNGEYSSPALEEIQHEISDLRSQGGGTEWYTLTINAYSGTLPPDALAQLKSHWPHVMVSIGTVNLLYPMTFIGAEYIFQSNIPSTRGNAYANGISVNNRTGEYSENKSYYAPNWDKVRGKPFSTIGTGLKVVGDALTVDTAAIPTGITANTTWGELES